MMGVDIYDRLEKVNLTEINSYSDGPLTKLLKMENESQVEAREIVVAMMETTAKAKI